MRPRFHVRLTPDDQIAIAKWRRRMGGTAMIFVAVVATWSLFNSHLDHGFAARASERPSDPTCIAWDTSASEAIVTFVQGNKENMNLQRVSNAIDRMRRARRTCQLGLPNLACEDYRAVVREVALPVESNSNITIDCAPTSTADLKARQRVMAPR